jgi:hypothetical protein
LLLSDLGQLATRVAILEAENALLRRELARGAAEHHGKLKPFYPLIGSRRDQGKSYQVIADEIIGLGVMATKHGVRSACVVLGCTGVRAKPGRPKLNEIERGRMQRARTEGLSYEALGRRFGVSASTARNVCNER